MATEKISTSIIADDAVSTDQIANDASISTSGNITTTGSGALTVAGTSTLTGALSVDTISEKTSANGVSIDGLKIKDYSLMYGSNIGITIDSNGYVSKPNHPIFATKFDGFTVDSTQYTVASVYSVGSGYNQGSHFTSSGTNKGRFTAPVAGWYHFYQSFLRFNVSTVIRGQFFINGSHSGTGSTEARTTEAYTGYTFVEAEAFFKLSANDYVEARWKADDSGVAIYTTGGGNTYNMFAGYLIG